MRREYRQGTRQSTTFTTSRPAAVRRWLVPARRRGDIQPGHIPSGDADQWGGAVPGSRVVADGERLGLPRPQGDVVAGPDRRLKLIISVYHVPPCGAPA